MELFHNFHYCLVSASRSYGELTSGLLVNDLAGKSARVGGDLFGVQASYWEQSIPYECRFKPLADQIDLRGLCHTLSQLGLPLHAQAVSKRQAK